MTRALAGGAALVAAAVALMLARGPSDDVPAALPQTGSPPLDRGATTARAEVEPTPPPRETPAAAKVRELEVMSETFRNTTFLIAIRDAGFVCHELLRVYGGLDESAKWMATCSGMLAYTVSVAESGALRIDPMLQYFDGVNRIVIEQGSDPLQVPNTRSLRDQLPPQTR